MGIESKFVNGLRVTDRETRDAAVMVFGGLLNKRVAGAISLAGQPAVGISASDAACFLAEPMQVDEHERRAWIRRLSHGSECGFSAIRFGARASCRWLPAWAWARTARLYNINADHMAAAAAEFIHADRLIFLTDVAGVLDGEKVLRAVRGAEIEELIRPHKVSGGMILKLEAAKRALAAEFPKSGSLAALVPRALLAAANWRALPRDARTSLSPADAGKSSSRSGVLKMAKKKKIGGEGSAFSGDNSRRRGASFDEYVQASARACSRTGADAAFTIRRWREYLDFLGGIAVNALGYSHPRLVHVIRREAGRAIHLSNLVSQSLIKGRWRRSCASWSGLDRVFFTNSGTEAMDGALKLARAYAHAKGAAACSAGAKTKHSGAGKFVSWADVWRAFDYLPSEVPRAVCASGARRGVCAVQRCGRSGSEVQWNGLRARGWKRFRAKAAFIPVSAEFWNRARALATQHDAALIADEIQCGLGRTGRHFAYQKFDSLPDIVTVAKPLAGGLPLGAFIANEKFAAAFTPGMHGTTFGGGPLVCAAALEFMNVMESEKLLTTFASEARNSRKGLEKLAARFAFIREIRGEGLIVGVDLTIEGAPLVRKRWRRDC